MAATQFLWPRVKRRAFARLTTAQRFAVVRAKAEQTLARLRAWDEADHPRVPAGSPDGGQFGSGGGGGGGAAEKPASAKTGKDKGKAKITDFAKDGVGIDNATATNDRLKDKFIERWNDVIAEAPAQFREQFLGGLNGSMKIKYNEREDEIKLSGSLHDADGHNIGEYDRTIDLDDKKASSDFFKVYTSSQGKGIGKKMLAGNIAMYEKLGIERLTVNAGLDNGGYAWAKYGYVPTKDSWRELSSSLLRDLGATRTGPAARVNANTYTPDEWESIGSDDQDRIRNAWVDSTRDEFVQSEIENWRNSGDALDDTKDQLAYRFTSGTTDDWAKAALTTWRELRAENGEPKVPFTNEQILAAVDMSYETGYQGEKDPEIEFDDKRLDELTPEGFDPAQQTLPGFEPPKPSDMLGEDVRKEIVDELTAAFNKEAGEKADDADPPEYLADQVNEYQLEYWDSMDEDQRYQWASRNSELPEYPLDEEDQPPDPEPAPPPEPSTSDPIEAIRQLLRSDNPKAIWAIADSTKGKSLLRGTGWNGVLNLKDADSMKRFKAYVGSAK